MLIWGDPQKLKQMLSLQAVQTLAGRVQLHLNSEVGFEVASFQPRLYIS